MTSMSENPGLEGPGAFEKTATLADVTCFVGNLSPAERSGFGLDSPEPDGLDVGLLMRGGRAHLERHGPASSRPERPASWIDLNRSWRVMCQSCGRAPVGDLVEPYPWSCRRLLLAKALDNLTTMPLLLGKVPDLASLVVTCEDAVITAARSDWDLTTATSSWFERRASTTVEAGAARAREFEHGTGSVVFIRDYPLNEDLGRAASSIASSVLGASTARADPSTAAALVSVLERFLLRADPAGVSTRAWAFPDPGLSDSALEVLDSLCRDALTAGREPSEELVAVAHSL
jgi:hypothetical protein